MFDIIISEQVAYRLDVARPGLKETRYQRFTLPTSLRPLPSFRGSGSAIRPGPRSLCASLLHQSMVCTKWLLLSFRWSFRYWGISGLVYVPLYIVQQAL